MKNNAGFSLMEAMILLVISSLLILASMPVLSRKSTVQGNNTSIVQCIQKEGAAVLTSPACAATITGSLYNRNNYFDTLMNYVDGSNSTLSTAGLKVLKAVCDEGGSLACSKLIDRCASDINKCSLDNDYDLEFYLNLLPNETNLSTEYIRNILTGYYNVGIPNIVTKVNQYCCLNNSYNLACTVKGITSCATGPWQKEINKGTDTGNDIAIDNSGNVYVLITTDNASTGNKISIIKINANGSKVWDVGVSGIDTASQITYGADGYIYAIGTVTVSSTNSDIAVMKVSASTGNVIWAKKYGDNQNIKDVGMGVTADANFVYAIGYTITRAPRSDLRLLKIDNSTGELVTNSVKLFKQYVVTSPSSPNDYSSHEGVAVTLVNDSLYFTESYEPTTCPDDIRVLIGKASTSDLSIETTSVIISGGLNNITVTGMTSGKDASTGNINLYVTAYNAASPNGVLVVYDTSADKITHIYKYYTTIKINHVAAINNSDLVYLIGTSNDSIAIICVKVSDGSVVWKRRINNSSSSLELEGKGIVVSSMDQYSFTVASSTNNNAFALKLPLTLYDDTLYSFPDGVIHDLAQVSKVGGLLKVDPTPPTTFTETDINTTFVVTYTVTTPSPKLIYN